MTEEQKSIVSDFMEKHKKEIRELIAGKELEDTFDSHAFYRRFAHKFEIEYVEMLAHYAKSGDQPFMKVHTQIARFLGDKGDELNITKKGKKPSPNIFGNPTENEEWEKTAT